MPKRTDIKSILIIGAGPIIIGQACEFDYSGVQAVKALKAEGYRVILVNSNPATIMTDPELADATYIEPITPEMVEKIIAQEKPDALLPTMGGQTALNCALTLERTGVLKKYNVEMIGAKADVIEKAEDRQKFRDAMDKIGLESPRSRLCNTHGRSDGRARLRAAARRSSAPRSRSAASAAASLTIVEEFEEIVDARPRRLADQRSAGRRKHHRLERIRDGGRPRQGGQLHHHLLDREHRSDGRAYGRLDHRRAGADADRPRISDHAQCQHRGAARDRRRDRRLERAIRGQSAKTAAWS